VSTGLEEQVKLTGAISRGAMKIIRVFVSSPGDVNAERSIADRILRATAEEFGIPVSVQYSNLLRTGQQSLLPGAIGEMANGRMGETANKAADEELVLCPYFWEYQRFSSDLGYQDQIPNPAQFDLVICILWSRLGTKLHPRFRLPDGSEPRSGTEFELGWAKEQRKKTPGIPALQVYRNLSRPNPPVDAPAKLEEFLQQWKALEDFLNSWSRNSEGAYVGAFNSYKSLEEFEHLFREHFRDFLFTQICGERERLLMARRSRPRRWTENPFRGLEVFDFEHAPIFHGRTKEIGEVLEALQVQLREHKPFVLLVGPSGSGKSSLVRAGLLPLLTQPETIEGIALWRWVVTRPGGGGRDSDCFDSLASALLEPSALPVLKDPESADSVRDLAVELRGHADSIALRLRDALDHVAREWKIEQSHCLTEKEREFREAGRPDDADVAREQRERLALPRTRLALVIDQLEELFTSGFSLDTQRKYVATVAGLARSSRVFVIATLRSDFYPSYQQFPDLIELSRPAGKVDLRPPTGNEIGNMIRLPAEAAGLKFEEDQESGQQLDQALVEVAGATPESLPLLEHVLALLYEAQANRGDGLVRWSDYRDLGELKGALAKHAEAVFTTLQPIEQAVFPVVMRSLVTLGQGEEEVPNRRTVLYRDFVSSSDRDAGARAFVDLFIKERLLVADTDPQGEMTVTVAHEALLREWQRVKVWLKENREFLRMRDRLDASLRLWRYRGNQKDDLLRPGLPLAEGEKLVKEFEASLSLEAATYVRASISETRRRRRIQDGIRYTILTAITGLAVFSGVQWFRAEGQRRSAAQALKSEAEIAGKLKEQLKQASWASFNQAERQFQLKEWNEAIALLARAIRFDPSNQVASQRFFHELIAHREKAMPIPIRSFAHHDVVYHASFDRDGGRVLTASWDKTAKLWDASSGNLIMTFAHDAAVNAAKFSPDGTRVVTASADKTAKVWDAGSGRFLSEFNHQDSVSDATFSPDGMQIATASADKTAKLWDISSGKLIATLAHQGVINAVAFSPDGKRILTASADKTARLWDAVSGAFIASFAHQGIVYFAGFSPDGSRVLTASADRTAKLWDANSATLLATFTHEDSVYYAAFSPDGTRVISASADKTAKLWETTPVKLVATLAHEGGVYRVAFSPDGERIATASWDRTAKLWTTSGNLVASFADQGELEDVVFSPDGSQILTASWDKTVKLWEARMGELIASFAHSDGVNAVAFSPDGESVLTASADTRARLWDSTSGKLIRSFQHEAGVNAIAFSPDGSRVLTGSADRTAKIWEVKTGTLIGTFSHDDAVNSAAFSPDGMRIVTAGSDKKAKLWDANSGKLLLTVVHDEGVNAAAFSPDGRRILTASADKTAKLWDALTGNLLASFEHGDSVNQAVFSPDGAQILTACADGTANLWDAARGKIVQVFAHEEPVRCAVFSPDGARILTGSIDNVARLWDVASGKVLAVFNHQDTIRCAGFSRDGARALTGSADNTARLWDLATPNALAQQIKAVSDENPGTGSSTYRLPSDGPPVEMLSEIAVGLRFSADGLLVTVDEQRRQQLKQAVRSLLDARPVSARFTRWFLSAGGERTLFPASNTKAVEWVHNTLLTNSDLSEGWLRSTLITLPDDPLLHVALAKFENNPQRANFLRTFGLARLPNDSSICVRVAQMLMEQHEPKLALTAVEKGLLTDATNESAQHLRLKIVELLQHDSGQGATDP
jgi:WD40 repeat protein/tetratricopeptide (TPR) repeat protein